MPEARWVIQMTSTALSPGGRQCGQAPSTLDAVRHRDTMSPEGPGPQEPDVGSGLDLQEGPTEDIIGMRSIAASNAAWSSGSTGAHLLHCAGRGDLALHRALRW